MTPCVKLPYIPLDGKIQYFNSFSSHAPQLQSPTNNTRRTTLDQRHSVHTTPLIETVNTTIYLKNILASLLACILLLICFSSFRVLHVCGFCGVSSATPPLCLLERYRFNHRVIPLQHCICLCSKCLLHNVVKMLDRRLRRHLGYTNNSINKMQMVV
jgi:hypothetical protein